MFDQVVATARRLSFAACAAGLLAGCAYDPYTGTYVPCCAYRPYYYGPPPYAPPPAAVPEGGMGRVEPAPAPSYQPQSYEAPATGGRLAQRFQQANTAQDGRLTLQQAQQSGWQRVARNFAAIDTERKGYVTLSDVQSWAAARRGAAATQPG